MNEIYKTLSNLNPRYIQELFERNSSSYSTRRPNDLKIPRVNQTSYGSRSIKFEGAKLWNHLAEDTKSAENLNTLKSLLKTGLVLFVVAAIASIQLHVNNDYTHVVSLFFARL